MAPPNKSKTLASWLAFIAGSLGLHRLYLYGFRDVLAWLHPLPTALGVIGLQRMLDLGQDDRLAWLLLPLLGLMVGQGMFMAILHALTPDEKWDARHNPGADVTATGWGPVLAAILSLLIGGGVLMATVAFSIQMFFQWQLEAPAPASESPDPAPKP
ncbi:MAG: TM2 domain-containing protein [Rubrivivax sp.]|jgi:hypothetical protein|nr:TM2 domain-containing protein [Rubrivivax sp.]